MPTEESKALVRWLVGASRTSLGEFYLARLNHAANGERELRERVHAVLEDMAWVLLADLLREHGEEIVAELNSPQRRQSA